MDYKKLYAEKKISAEQLVDHFRNGWQIFTDAAAATPPAIVNALGEEAKSGTKSGIRLHIMTDLAPYRALEKEAASGILPISWFSGKGLAAAFNEGRGDIMPCHYHDMPSLHREFSEVDAFVAVVSPMDKHGWFSAGAAASKTESLIHKAKHIYKEVFRHENHKCGYYQSL